MVPPRSNSASRVTRQTFLEYTFLYNFTMLQKLQGTSHLLHCYSPTILFVSIPQSHTPKHHHETLTPPPPPLPRPSKSKRQLTTHPPNPQPQPPNLPRPSILATRNDIPRLHISRLLVPVRPRRHEPNPLQPRRPHQPPSRGVFRLSSVSY